MLSILLMLKNSMKKTAKRTRHYFDLKTKEMKSRIEDTEKRSVLKNIALSILLFFESVPLFLGLFLATCVILIVVSASIVIFMTLSSIPNTSGVKSSNDTSMLIADGPAVWSAEELELRGANLTNYEKNLYRLFVLAKEATTGYGTATIPNIPGSTNELDMRMMVGIQSTEKSMAFYNDDDGGKNIFLDISDRAPANGDQYGNFGLSITMKYKTNVQLPIQRKINSKYTPRGDPERDIDYFPWSVSMSAAMMNTKYKNFVKHFDDEKLVKESLKRWGIIENSDYVSAVILYCLTEAQYHGALASDHDAYVQFLCAVYCATSDNDSERSFDKITVKCQSYAESPMRLAVVGDRNFTELTNISSVAELRYSGSGAKLYINGVKLTVPLWVYLHQKFASNPDMIKAENGFLKHLHGSYPVKILNFHYGLNSLIQGTRMQKMLNSKLISISSTSNSDVIDMRNKLLSRSETLLGLKYQQLVKTVTVIMKGSYVNGEIRNGVFIGAFDCSDFTEWCYKGLGYGGAGWNTAQSQSELKYTRISNISDLVPGDLMFFHDSANSSRTNDISHVAIYHHSGYLIHESSSFGACTIAPIGKWQTEHFSHGLRILDATSDSTSVNAGEFKETPGKQQGKMQDGLFASDIYTGAGVYPVSFLKQLKPTFGTSISVKSNGYSDPIYGTPFYSQRWNYLEKFSYMRWVYSASTDSTFLRNGCMIYANAFVLSSKTGKLINPPEMSILMISNNCLSSAGITMGNMKKLYARYGIKCVNITDISDRDKVWKNIDKTLEKGGLVVYRVKASCYTSYQHFMVLVAKTRLASGAPAYKIYTSSNLSQTKELQPRDRLNSAMYSDMLLIGGE